MVEETDKILMMVTLDSNNDKRFDEDDVVTPMIYNLKTNTPSKEVFDADFMLKVKKLLSKTWVKKDNKE